MGVWGTNSAFPAEIEAESGIVLGSRCRIQRIGVYTEKMTVLKSVISVFLFLEAANVITLYWFPGSTYANGVGVFKAWERSKRDPAMHRFVRYLVNWVAGTKLIFILLLIVMLFTVDDRGLILTGIAMVLSIASFFWRLYPLIRKMDRAGEIDPPRYSLVLGGMILGFILAFLIVTVAAGSSDLMLFRR